MLDESRREELTARLQELHDSGSVEPSEPAQEETVETQQVDSPEPEERQKAESSAAEEPQETAEASEGHQTGAQKRISELVRQRNSSNEQLRALQEQLQQMQQQQQQAQQAQQAQYNPEEHDWDYEQPEANPELLALQNEFHDFRNNHIQEQVKNQLESEIAEAVGAHPDLDPTWLRRELINAVRLDGNADLKETAEYYQAFVNEIKGSAAPNQNEVSQTRQPADAPPRPASRSTASADLSQSGGKPLTREQARQNAIERLRAL